MGDITEWESDKAYSAFTNAVLLKKYQVNKAFVDDERIYTTSQRGQQHSKEAQDQDGSKQEVDSEKSDDIPPVSFLRLFRFASKFEAILMILAMVVVILVSAMYPVNIVVFGKMVNTFIENLTSNSSKVSYNKAGKPCGNATVSTDDTHSDLVSQINVLCIYLAAIAIFITMCNYIIVTLFSIVGNNQAFRIRCLFMKSILRQDIGWYDTNQTGDFAIRMTADLSRIREGIGEKVGMCAKYIFACAFMMVCALVHGWKLSLVILAPMPVPTIATAAFSKIQSAVAGHELSEYGSAGAVAEEVLSSIKTVVAFGGENKEIQRYERYLQLAKKKGITRGVLTALSTGVTRFCMYSTYALCFWYGVKLMGEEPNNYKGNTITIVFLNIIFCYLVIGQTSPYLEAFNSARGAAAKVFSIIDRVPAIDSRSDAGKVPATVRGNITLHNVHFSYPARQDVPVLRGISLDIKTGETVALVGASGCGKSTVIQLIQRFYDVNEGQVFIDENNVADLNVGWLRQNMGVVSQEPVLFSGTIADNIRYGKIDATDEEIQAAAKASNVHDFIAALPQGYNTVVGERGTQLSGGQKQRIAIARALVRNPKILLLDEATSALDTESESLVQRALDKASEGRTTILVAHRLSTIRTAEKIVVISDGSVKEIGTHDELMSRKGIYSELVMTQVGAEIKYDEENEEDTGVLDKNPKETLQRQASTRSSCSYTLDESVQIHILEHALQQMNQSDDEAGEVSKFRLMRASSPEWPYIAIGGIFSLLSGTVPSAFAVIYGKVFGAMSESKEQMVSYTDTLSLMLFGLGIGYCISTFSQITAFSVAGERLTARLRKLVFSTMIIQDMSWFDLPENNVGSLCSKLSADASSVQGATGSRISTILQSISTLVCGIAVGMYYNAKLGSVALAFVPVLLILNYFRSLMTAGQMLSEDAAIHDASKVAIEVIGNIRTVASLHREETFYLQFKTYLVAPLKKSRKESHVRGLIYGFAESLPWLILLLIMFYGTVLISRNEVEYSTLFIISEALIIGTITVGQAFAFAPDYEKAKLGAAKIFKFLDLRSKLDAASKEGVILDCPRGSVEYQNVYFNYPSRPNVRVLRGLKLRVEPGKTVALVGSSGCGKSTCVQLIERFYDPRKGNVLLDNTNIEHLEVSFLRSQLSVVSQEPILFSCSLAENIAYGDNSRDVSMDEIITAAKQANIHNFIASLPEGYCTAVGAKGTQLSGGQKQRVAIARALIRDPKILLLDEATSALDAESEKVVQEALDKASSGRTCIIIAHRLSTIQNADKIAVIQNGRVVEEGKHQELLEKRGHYYNLHAVQSGAK